MLNFNFMPEQASTFAMQYDILFWMTTVLTVVFTLLVGGLVIFFALRYKQGNKVNRQNPVDHNSFLELAWSVIPMFLALIMFAWNAKLFVDMRTPPADAMEIFVIGKQWMWHSQHENGIRENNRLTIPVNRPVRLTMISQDVLHSFYIPQFRIKQDVIPGRYTSQWFEPIKTGTYNLFCTEYCGTQHSEMGGYVRVLTEADWAKWVANGGDDLKPGPTTIADRGKLVYERMNCASCHTAQDNDRGPTLYGLVGSTRTMTDGKKMVADRDYIRGAIKTPYANLTDGYQNTMPEYKELSEDDLLALYEFIKTLGVQPAAIRQDQAPTQN